MKRPCVAGRGLSGRCAGADPHCHCGGADLTAQGAGALELRRDGGLEVTQTKRAGGDELGGEPAVDEPSGISGGNLDLVAAEAEGASGDVSFLGVAFTAGELVARVRITSGNAALGPVDAPAATDVVVMDDFLYSEPLELFFRIPTLSTWGVLLLGTLLAFVGIMRARSTRGQRR